MAYQGLRFNWTLDATGKAILVIDAEETSLIEIPLTDRDISLMSYYDEMGREEAKKKKGDGK